MERHCLNVCSGPRGTYPRALLAPYCAGAPLTEGCSMEAYRRVRAGSSRAAVTQTAATGLGVVALMRAMSYGSRNSGTPEWAKRAA